MKAGFPSPSAATAHRFSRIQKSAMPRALPVIRTICTPSRSPVLPTVTVVFTSRTVGAMQSRPGLRTIRSREPEWAASYV